MDQSISPTTTTTNTTTTTTTTTITVWNTVHLWHMPHGITLLPLPRMATTTICSSSSLLVAAFTQHLASHPPSAPLLKLLRLYQVHSLQLSPTHRVSLSSLGNPPKNSGTSFYARIHFWLGIALQQLAHLTKGANTSSRVLYFSPRSKVTNTSFSSSSCLHSWCIPHNLRFVTKSPVWKLSSWILQSSVIHIRSS